MFDFLSMSDNYEDRKVDRFDGDGFIVDTCSVTDSDEPYETGIQHPKYNDGKWVIVEMYEDMDSAQKGHDKWVKTMTASELPNELMDVSTCTLKKMLDSLA